MAAEELAACAVGLTTLALTAKDEILRAATHSVHSVGQQADTVLDTLHSLHTGVGLQYWLFQWMVNDNFHGSVDDSQ